MEDEPEVEMESVHGYENEYGTWVPRYVRRKRATGAKAAEPPEQRKPAKAAAVTITAVLTVGVATLTISSSLGGAAPSPETARLPGVEVFVDFHEAEAALVASGFRADADLKFDANVNCANYSNYKVHAFFKSHHPCK